MEQEKQGFEEVGASSWGDTFIRRMWEQQHGLVKGSEGSHHPSSLP
jgi:hypothetical protein